MDKTFLFFKMCSAIIFGFGLYLLGGWDCMLETLITLSLLDIVTGVIVACVQGTLSSKIAWAGFARKIGTYVIVAVAVKLDLLFGSNAMRGGAVGFFIGVEGISVIENWGNIGLPMPKKIRQVLAQLKEENSE